MAPYRIIIADDHSLIRQGLKILVHTDATLSVVGEASNGQELLDRLQEQPADMVIVDITMPQLNGIDAVAKIRTLYPQIAILVLTMHSGSHYFYQAMAAGADGYLMKDDSDLELLTAIGAIRTGKPYVSSRLSTELAEGLIGGIRNHHTPPLDALSDREKQVLHLVVQGLSSKEIGNMLKLSPRTIDHHRASVLKKFKMKNTVDLVNHVISNGILLSDA